MFLDTSGCRVPGVCRELGLVMMLEKLMINQINQFIPKYNKVARWLSLRLALFKDSATTLKTTNVVFTVCFTNNRYNEVICEMCWYLQA